MVFVNDQMVYQRWASEFDSQPISSPEKLKSSGWQYATVDLSKYPEGTTITLAFYAGNDNLNLPSPEPHQTWVYVDHFSTNEAVVNSAATFTIHAQPGDITYYRLGDDPTVYPGPQFSLSAQPSNDTIWYWSANHFSTETPNSFHVVFDDTPPTAVSDLAATPEKDQQFLLTWSSPHDEHLASYEVRYAVSPITPQTRWEDLQSVPVDADDGLPGSGYRSPRPEHEQERYLVTVQPVSDYYFVVRSMDTAGNISELSNIVHASEQSSVQPQIQFSLQPENMLQLDVLNAESFATAHYIVEYAHILDDGQLQTEAVSGEVQIQNLSTKTVQVYLGTCSSNGVCVPYQVVSDSVKISVTLKPPLNWGKPPLNWGKGDSTDKILRL